MKTVDDQVRLAVEETCGCVAMLKEAVAVSETFQGDVAWEGVVYVRL